MQIDTHAQKIEDREVYSFREINWKEFRRNLQPKIEDIPTHEVFEVQGEFDMRMTALTEALKSIVREVVPQSRITRYAKRWWTEELTGLYRELKHVRNRARKYRYDPQDPIHETLRTQQNKFTQKICKTK